MLKENMLPTQIDLFRFANHATSLKGTLHIKEMQRLASSLHTNEGGVDVEIEFGIDRQGIRFLRGQFAVGLTLQCQRCLRPFVYKMESCFLLGVVCSEEEASQLPARYDPLIVKEGMLVIQDVFEDELIVSLPIVPMHQLSDCKIKLPLVAETDETITVGKESPFKVIEFLKVRS
ncbi:MAG: hypothetical protein K0S27_1322 [Gammaproteobacteria bacterium]|jgi:uncharacterized protein|nr:hypothetical protein [Gammaproteobacteria bacterium]